MSPFRVAELRRTFGASFCGCLVIVRVLEEGSSRFGSFGVAGAWGKADVQFGAVRVNGVVDRRISRVLCDNCYSGVKVSENY